MICDSPDCADDPVPSSPLPPSSIHNTYDTTHQSPRVHINTASCAIHATPRQSAALLGLRGSLRAGERVRWVCSQARSAEKQSGPHGVPWAGHGGRWGEIK